MATADKKYTPGTTVRIGEVIPEGLPSFNTRVCVVGTHRESLNNVPRGTALNDKVYEVTSVAHARELFGQHSDVLEYAAGWFQKNTSSFMAINVKDTSDSTAASNIEIDFDTAAFNNNSDTGVYSFYVDGREYRINKVEGADFSAFRSLIFSHLGQGGKWGVELPSGEAQRIRILNNYKDWSHKGVHNVYFPNDTALGVQIIGNQNYFNFFGQSASHPHNYSDTIQALSNAEFDKLYVLYDQDFVSMLVGDQSSDNFAAGVVGNANVVLAVDPHSLRYDRQVEAGNARATVVSALQVVNFFDPNDTTTFEADLLAFSTSSNDARLTAFTRQGTMEHIFRFMGELAGVVKTRQDRDLSNTLTGAIFTNYHDDVRDFTAAERENLLRNGFSTFKFVQGGLAIERLRTAYTKLPGVGDFDDGTLSDFRNVSILFFVRRDLENHLNGLYRNRSIGQTGVNYAGDNVVTTDVIAAEIIARHENWVAAALVRATPQFAPSVRVTDEGDGQINVCFKILFTNGLYVLDMLMNIQQGE